MLSMHKHGVQLNSLATRVMNWLDGLENQK